MIIKLDTITREVTEIPVEQDENRRPLELEADIANLIATAAVGQAVKNYQHDNVRREYILHLYNAMLSMLKGASADWWEEVEHDAGRTEE